MTAEQITQATGMAPVPLPDGIGREDLGRILYTLHRAQLAAWARVHEVRYSAEHGAAFAVASDISEAWQDLMQATSGPRMRAPGEEPLSFAGRVGVDVNAITRATDATARAAARHEAAWLALPEAERTRRYDAMVRAGSGMAGAPSQVIP